tara:strand:+ start:906 stop:1640 length:735 start_codon:yes stop_codon:yes gene_type:complete
MDNSQKIISYLDQLKFYFIQQKTKRGPKYQIYKKIRKNFFKNDLFNLNKKCLNQFDKNYLEQIKKIKDYNHMSTPAIGIMFNRICRELNKDEVFVNIGAYKGFSTISGMINTCCEVHSVDNFSEYDKPEEILMKNFNLFKKDNHFFHKQDYEFFFKSWNKKIDFYIYDAWHSYEQQYKNLEIVHNFLNKNSIIYIDDYNDAEVQNGTQDFLAKYPKKYTILKEVVTGFNMHPTFWNGFILFKKN